MKIIAGVDEVGRGSLIGPVYAAAVILNKSINVKLLKDSKSITKNKRELLTLIGEGEDFSEYTHNPINLAPSFLIKSDKNSLQM